ncbi:GNAT family N-acetyltransferase [Planococcus lenghuensis]|uniref:GNAT family N-acetyltransferase n=1 Tax=Planococcus lenghuensis TaxID=2213202 RepID=A0A1Q2KW25_9BACL|nr:GNAT family N-acetyltransferase [Planococcus lenghuensis]AQQ52343.1 GNAT family N-acetyltransferase [Planococcus lenghuensis]
MEYTIRLLTEEDSPVFDAMDTGIEEDYVKRIFSRLVSGDNRLYGLFVENHLASVCGYTVFAGHYAMIGRVRSDVRYRGKDLATKLSRYIVEEASKLPAIRWVGANTQEENKAARRVLEKIGLHQQARLYGATAADVSPLIAGGDAWQEIHEMQRKQKWVNELYIKTGAVFPYECYYLFPASWDLFQEDELANWSFFENATNDRVLITKKDVKGRTYLHTIYPWQDLMEQPGLWETIDRAFQKLKTEEPDAETYIWMDLDEEAVRTLPDNQPFILPSPWTLYGIHQA